MPTPKKQKRFALGFSLFVMTIIPFIFWMTGWNFERNSVGIACVVTTLFVTTVGYVLIASLFDNK